MPLQNRVNPRGTIEQSSARGTFMGNRGVLHNGKRELTRQFKTKAWIICLLEFKGRKRELMTPGRYTELFFLDEVTAFAAGHRPCAECRRKRITSSAMHGRPPMPGMERATCVLRSWIRFFTRSVLDTTGKSLGRLL